MGLARFASNNKAVTAGVGVVFVVGVALAITLPLTLKEESSSGLSRSETIVMRVLESVPLIDGYTRNNKNILSPLYSFISAINTNCKLWDLKAQ
jgi:hypothetical protein